MKKLLKAIYADIYIRLSSKSQEDGMSKETQEKECRKYCEENGIIVRNVYYENKSAMTPYNRPVFYEMVAKQQSKDRADIIVSFCINRLTRNQVDFYPIRACLLYTSKGVKSNTEIKDVDNQNIYVWKIDYTAVNPINIEFYMLNWYAIIATVIVLLLLTLYILNSGKGKFDFSVILAKSKEFFANTAQKNQTTTTETKTVVKPKQKKNPAKFIVITLVLL